MKNLRWITILLLLFLPSFSYAQFSSNKIEILEDDGSPKLKARRIQIDQVSGLCLDKISSSKARIRVCQNFFASYQHATIHHKDDDDELDVMFLAARGCAGSENVFKADGSDGVTCGPLSFGDISAGTNLNPNLMIGNGGMLSATGTGRLSATELYAESGTAKMLSNLDMNDKNFTNTTPTLTVTPTEMSYLDGVTSQLLGQSDLGTLTNKTIDGASNDIKIRTHATDCTVLTDGKAAELCIDLDDGAIWRCEPTAGDCSGAEWKPLGVVGQTGGSLDGPVNTFDFDATDFTTSLSNGVWSLGIGTSIQRDTDTIQPSQLPGVAMRTDTPETVTADHTHSGDLILTGSLQTPVDDTLGNEGEATSDATDNQWVVYINSADRVFSPQDRLAYVVEDPTATEAIGCVYIEDPQTITRIHSVIKGSATPSVSFNLEERTSCGSVGTDVVASDIVETSTTTGTSTTTFANAPLASASYLVLTTSAQSGTVDELNVTVYLTWDRQ